MPLRTPSLRTLLGFAFTPALLLASGAACDVEPEADIDELAADDEIAPRSLTLEPNDPLYHSGQKWHYGAISLPEAWWLTTGSPAVTIAIADSGTLPHSELTWSSGYDFFVGDPDPTDPGDFHHGIHVAGTLAAAANNGVGGAGICWGCKLRPIRVKQSGGGAQVGDPGMNEPTTTLLARAIRYAAGLPTDNGRGETVQASSRADVINISIGNLAQPCPADLKDAIDKASEAGTVVVVAAGNGDSGTTWPPSPDFNASNYLWPRCQNPDLIVVTAVDAFGNAEPYALQSNPLAKYPGITIAAPGGSAVNGQAGNGALLGCPSDPTQTGTHGVVSTWIPYAQTGPQCHRHWAGTSMAAPHVSGVVGLMRARNPALTASQIKQILVKTAKPIPCTNCGAGMVNAFGAVQASTFTLSITCESTGGGGYACTSSPTGLGPWTATWQGVLNAAVNPAYANNPTTTHGTCTVNTQARVRATLTDALGRTAIAEDSFLCSQLPP
ncbi:S8 family serine peptidase [Nannocystis sp. ILAH1]|uniref:S8 family serine peptidase n=1 Tax=unclassified Nannocystis TaxID=2627009 RepID=UPI00226DBD55|nr:MULTISPECIES: S8 family serine peptidase [unclassified Nannocystis]MCY0994489.1 S8 family serine peptidase [Nannocystis sp. ILAH1]MCY1063575.1 S8 family serine peptidase [Nannocystis sp. RBIL2]